MNQLDIYQKVRIQQIILKLKRLFNGQYELLRIIVIDMNGDEMEKIDNMIVLV